MKKKASWLHYWLTKDGKEIKVPSKYTTHMDFIADASFPEIKPLKIDKQVQKEVARCRHNDNPIGDEIFDKILENNLRIGLYNSEMYVDSRNIDDWTLRFIQNHIPVEFENAKTISWDAPTKQINPINTTMKEFLMAERITDIRTAGKKFIKNTIGGSKQMKTGSFEQDYGIIAVYDDPKYADRYSVVFEQEEAPGMKMCLGVNDYPESPNMGFSQFTSCQPGNHMGKKIRFGDLPKNVQEHIKNRLTEGELKMGNPKKASTSITVYDKGRAGYVDFDVETRLYSASADGWWGPTDFTTCGIYKLIQPDMNFDEFVDSMVEKIHDSKITREVLLAEEPTETDKFWCTLGNSNYFYLTGKMGQYSWLDDQGEEGFELAEGEYKKIEDIITECINDATIGKDQKELARMENITYDIEETLKERLSFVSVDREEIDGEVIEKSIEQLTEESEEMGLFNKEKLEDIKRERYMKDKWLKEDEGQQKLFSNIRKAERLLKQAEESLNSLNDGIIGGEHSVKTAMSKKDYIAIANVIKGETDVKRIVEKLCDIFQKDNPLFKCEQFMEACGF